MENFCTEHTNIVQSLGRIEAKLDALIDTTQRANGTFTDHVKDSDYWRAKVTKHGTILSTLLWVSLAVLIAIIKLFIK